MFISGLQKLTLIDYPGHIACVVFTVGCNLRCGYCHNPEFVLPERIVRLKAMRLAEEEFFDFLRKRQGLLEGVSICGGEPTIHSDLMDFIRKIRDLGYKVKLDTNGSRPESIKHLLDQKLVDYIAMDIKHIWEKYAEITGKTVDTTLYQESTHLILEKAPDYEFRTTVIEGFHTPDTIRTITEKQIFGAKNYYLQAYRSGETLDPYFSGNPWTSQDYTQALTYARDYVEHCELRI